MLGRLLFARPGSRLRSRTRRGLQMRSYRDRYPRKSLRWLQSPTFGTKRSIRRATTQTRDAVARIPVRTRTAVRSRAAEAANLPRRRAGHQILTGRRRVLHDVGTTSIACFGVRHRFGCAGCAGFKDSIEAQDTAQLGQLAARVYHLTERLSDRMDWLLWPVHGRSAAHASKHGRAYSATVTRDPTEALEDETYDRPKPDRRSLLEPISPRKTAAGWRLLRVSLCPVSN